MEKQTLNMIRESNIIFALRHILIKKSKTADDYQQATQYIKELISITEGTDAKAYVFLGKLFLSQYRNREAAKAFKQAITFNPISAASYHGLFKIDMINENYESALNNINLYSKYSGIDCSIYVALLNKLINNRDITFDNKDNILGQYKLSAPIMINYNLALKYINAEDYHKAIKHINVCQKLLNIKGIIINLSYVEDLLIKLRNKYFEHDRRTKLKEIKETILTSDNNGSRYMLLNEFHDLEPNNINVLILLIEISITFEDYEQAAIYLNKALEFGITLPRLENYHNIIEEQMLYSEDFLNNARSNQRLDMLLECGKYEQAKELSTKRFEETGNPAYIYSLAYTLYMEGKLEESAQLFIKYITLGNTYLKMSYYCLFFIAYELKNEDLANHYLVATYNLSKFYNINISLEDWKKLILEYKDSFDFNSMTDIERRILGDNLGNDKFEKQYINN